MSDDRRYLSHILGYISRVEEYVAEGQDSFMGSTLIQDAVMRNLQILGESSRRLSQEIRAGHPEVDWRGIVGFRNIMVHNFLGITLIRVWEVVELDLPTLKIQLEVMLSELGNQS